MTYKEFILCVRDGIALRCDDEDEVMIKKITKNNGLVLDAVVIQRKGRVASPTIYLKRYFEEYRDGMRVEDIIETIMFIEKNCKLECDVKTKDLASFDYVRDHVCMKLIHAQKNEELLKELPHRMILDLAVVYYVMVETKDDCMASFLIREKQREAWGITEEALHQLALQNTFNHFPVVVTSMHDVIVSMMPKDASKELQSAVTALEEQEENQMFVVTNDAKHFGAAALIYDEFLETFGKAHGDFIVLPSSIHELIFLTDVKEPDRDWLYHMVKNVNETELSVDEVLSESVYYYDCETKSVRIL